MLFGGVVPFAYGCPFLSTVYGCVVLPRKSGPAGVLKRNVYVMSGVPSPFRSILILYRAAGENVYQFGPAAGSSPGIQFDTIVRVFGSSGLRNAYRSVLSADGSS